jgi:hypothetical protein
MQLREAAVALCSWTEVAREGARQMLAQVLIAEADAFVAPWKDRTHEPGPHRQDTGACARLVKMTANSRSLCPSRDACAL